MTHTRRRTKGSCRKRFQFFKGSAILPADETATRHTRPGPRKGLGFFSAVQFRSEVSDSKNPPVAGRREGRCRSCPGPSEKRFSLVWGKWIKNMHVRVHPTDSVTRREHLYCIHSLSCSLMSVSVNILLTRGCVINQRVKARLNSCTHVPCSVHSKHG